MKRFTHDADLRGMVVLRSLGFQLVPFKLHRFRKQRRVKYKKSFSIAELTKERLRRAGAKVSADNPDWQGDTGFRVFKLDTSNIRPWSADAASLDAQMQASLSPLLEDRSQDDVMTEL
ncbi:hypothetical protein G9457_03565 [Aeromonas salmonicida subsp. masoucida]|nr:hypothetical protein [Aeromonas salmonicida]QYH29235.1 hypothetical protein G9457_03565 [Aeromonas salmonicida subsp. masoucida]